MVPNFGGSPQVVLMQPKLKIGKLKILRKTVVFCSLAQNFLLQGPYFHRAIFQPRWALPVAVIVWGLCPPPPARGTAVDFEWQSHGG